MKKIKILKRHLRLIPKIAAGFLLLCLCIFVFFVHPRDSRITLPDLNTFKPKTEYQIKLGSLFIDQLPFSLDVSQEDYKRGLSQLKQDYPNHLKFKSERFNNPYQAYISLGSYPEKLEGRDVVILPSKASLLLQPQWQGEVQVEFSLATLHQQAKLTLLHNNTVAKNFDIRPASIPTNTDSTWYRYISRYLFPNLADSLITWQNQSVSMLLKAGDSLTFYCQNQEHSNPCIVSELEFYTKTKVPEPNTILIIVDTMRGDAITKQGSPFLQELSQGCQSFSQAIAAGNMTSPSTNAMFSCRKASDLGSVAFSYAVSHEDQEAFYRTHRPSFPKFIQDHKTLTAMMGNISIVSEILGIGINHGFSQQVGVEREAYDTPQLTKEAMNWLEKNGQKPFFLYLHYHAPHAPYRPPLYDLFKTFPGFNVFSDYSSLLKWLYQAEIHFSDRYIKTLVKTLDTLAIRQHTRIILSADHGDHHEVRTFTHNEGPAYRGSFFDHGATLFNDEIRVPLLICDQKRSKVIDNYVSLLDIGPTILEMNQIEIPYWCQGLPLQHIETNPDLYYRSIASEGFSERTVIRADGIKYTRAYGPVEKRLIPEFGFSTTRAQIFQAESLYDLKQDPKEAKDLSRDKLLLLEDMRVFYRNYYDIKSTYELIIDSPLKSDIKIRVPKEDIEIFQLSKVESDSGSASQQIDEFGGLQIIVKNQEQIKAIFSSTPFNFPEVLVGDEPIAIKMTSLRLPLNLDIGKLPLEEGGDYNMISVSKFPTAYIRKIENDQTQKRHIIKGNAQFEKILRDWGYLNDTN